MATQIEKMAEEYAVQFKIYASSEGLENIASDFLAGASAQAEIDREVMEKQREALELFKASFPVPPTHDDGSGRRTFAKDSNICKAWRAMEAALKLTEPKEYGATRDF